MKKLLAAAAASATVFAAGAASAAINVSVWINHQAAAENVTFANVAALGAADATLTLPLLNFSTNSSTGTTIDQFLGSSIGGAVGGHALNNSVFEFTGSLFLNAGNNTFSVLHDDGLQLIVQSFGLVVDFPGGTSATQTPFSLNAASAGNYSFDMVYGESFGGPAVIRFDVNEAPVTGGGVPEPATWAMMLVGFGGLGAMMRRRRTLVAA